MTLKIIYQPDLPDWEKFPAPRVSAENYRDGTIVEDERGARWKVYWDTQDHRLEWQRVEGFPVEPKEEAADVEQVEAEWEYGFYDSDDQRTPPVVFWWVFGILKHKTAASAYGTGRKSTNGQPVIVRHRVGESDSVWELVPKEEL